MQAVVVAGNQEDRDFLSFVLRYAGLAVATSADLQRISATLVERPVDLIVVSAVNNPALVKNIEATRSTSQAALLVLVDHLTEEQHVTLLEAGADLVLERPVSSRVLSRYAWVFLRRAAELPAFALPALELDEIVLDPATRIVTMPHCEPQPLTQLEFRLLYVLMTNRGQIIPTEVIVEHVWGYTGEDNRDLVRGLVRRLRRKIELDPDHPRFVQNVPGLGYRFSLE
ncbi:MAG: response regulator transcription factor [Chloroflexi bacterium]|nr:response regulator transcription factor [Chloroflexota bacterium]MCI0578397.1 response regulator transcription factor [Chloroflexota bacterium]MCI0647606.1 response regulator transcription factor [Chloroflexota bacterium]MCI0730425.1 response regulator transcription factor [Chloroflexota bacterium]